ncbi:hypothetical protein Tco_0595717 [Tanacetum coccineum]
MANVDFCDKHNMVAFLQKPTGSEEFHQIVDFLASSHIRYALTANPTIYVSLIEQFWKTITVNTVNDREQQLTITVDGQTIVITEAFVRRHLQLADADGISSLPNTEIFDQLTLMGYVSNDDKLTFQKGVHVPLFDTMMIHDQPGQGEGPTITVESQHTPIASLPTSQPTTSQLISSQEQPSQVPITEPITDSFTMSYPTQKPSPMPHDSPFSGGHTLESYEGSKKLNELKELCTKLSDKVTNLEDDLKQTRKIYGKALTKLVKKVKHLEAKLKSTTERRKARMVISDDEEDLVSEDTSKQGRMTETEYEGFTLYAAKILADASREKVKTYTRRRSTDSSRHSIVGGLFSTVEEVQALELQKQLDEREETHNIDWNIVAEQVQERQSDTIKRYQTLKKKPVSVAQARKNMMIYLKNMAGYKMGYFKGMSYDEIRPIFEEEYNKIQTLFKKDTEVEKTKTKRIAEETLLQESFKKLRTAEASRSEPIQEQPTEEPKELSEEELKKMMEIVPVEEIKAEALQVKYPIIDWEIHTEGSRKYWKIIRVRNITEAYQVFEDMLKGFDREDLVTLWSLVKERFRSAEPTEDKERALWVELKRLFEPDKDDVLWKLQRYMYDPLTWRLYGTCGVHHVSSTRGHDIYMLIEKDYPLSTAVMNLMLSRRLQVEEDSEMAKYLLIKDLLRRDQQSSRNNEIRCYWKSKNDNNRTNIEWDDLSLNDWLKIKYGEVDETMKKKILTVHWRKRFRVDYDDNNDFYDPDQCEDGGNNKIRERISHNSHEEWFKGMSDDENDIKVIIDYLKPTSYDGFMDLDEEEYNR